MIKIYVVGGYNDYASWIPDHKLVRSVAEADLVLFAGGTDVDSALYHEPRHPAAQEPDRERDRIESLIFDEAVALKKHILGICRGAQFACVKSEGRLVQHQKNSGRHKIIGCEPQNGIDYHASYYVVSDHHQAQYPWNLMGKDYHLLGYTIGLSPYHQDGNMEEMSPPLEVEDVFYRSTRSLAIQTHPEWLDAGDPDEARTIEHYRKLLDLHLSNQL